MSCYKNNTRRHGFTLLEVIIALILIVIGISAAVAAIVTGKTFLAQAESKARAMRVALVKMEEYLAKSYTGLTPGAPITGTLGKVGWQVNVMQRYEGRNNTLYIPYKYIETKAFYNETDRAGNVYQKSIRLENIVPYPFIHTVSSWISRDRADDEAEFDADASSGNFTDATVIGDTDPLRVTVNYDVAKTFLIMYNVAINVRNPAGITPINTVLTGCFIDNQGPKPVVTRTPIISQPLISNVVGLTENETLSPGEHTIEIRWCKDTANGTVTLREANLMVVAIEKTQ